ncbi:MAG TPA: hypothetical protein V6D03_11505 [Candidatus Caenarcaniphilales bacterium]
MCLKQTASLLSLAFLTLACTALSAQAQTADSVTNNATSSLSAPGSEVAPTPTQAEPTAQEAGVAEPRTSEVAATKSAPISTSAAALTPNAAPANAGTVAQFDEVEVDVDPGTATRSGPSYVGIGGNVGFDEGDLNFSVLSKVGITNRVSVRPSTSIDFNEKANFRIPVTLDFAPQQQLGQFNISPYIGGGVAFSVGDDSDVGPMITAGIDVPLTPRFTATASVNVDFINDTNVGLLFGVGYNFPGLF